MSDGEGIAIRPHVDRLSALRLAIEVGFERGSLEDDRVIETAQRYVAFLEG